MARLHTTFLPFLYPCFESSYLRIQPSLCLRAIQKSRRYNSTVAENFSSDHIIAETRLDPLPDDYGRTIFADKCILNVCAGSGGHGCVSFVREKFIPEGSPNGGDGGTGGSIYIQAVREEHSLHKLTRRGIIKAGRGKNGQGKGKGGQRGEDMLIQVPVGTVVREISRVDPVAEEEEKAQSEEKEEAPGQFRRDKWILYPATLPSDFTMAKFPRLPQSRKSTLQMAQPEEPISLDLSQPMEKPILLATGGAGGFGNPHFLTRSNLKPKFASKGVAGISLSLQLELKLLADVGFVGMPNAGKSTLLRALSKSRARIGNWAFTTLQPNIGTVVLDDHHGRPHLHATHTGGDLRTQISIADIPGLVPDAHLDRGLGLGFLRHVERAQVLAFVVDLSAGDPVQTLQQLWREVGQFEGLKSAQTNLDSQHSMDHDDIPVEWKPVSYGVLVDSARKRRLARTGEDDPARHPELFKSTESPLPPLSMLAPISSKPWFVVATKADVEGTRDNFESLRTYLRQLEDKAVLHPSGRRNAWLGRLEAIPVSAIRGEGVERIPEWTVGLLED